MSRAEQKKHLIEELLHELPVLRARLGLSQEELAERIGVSRQTYGGIENGKRDMTWTVFMAFFGYFKSNERTLPMLAGKEGFLTEVEQVLSLEQ